MTEAYAHGDLTEGHCINSRYDNIGGGIYQIMMERIQQQQRKTKNNKPNSMRDRP
jgi:hypothetical protein